MRGDVVVLAAHEGRVEDTRGRGQRVHSRVNTLGRDLTGKLGRRIQVSEGRRRSRVGVVVGGNVDRLQRRDRVATGRGDALLEQTHFVSQVGLVANGRGHAAQQRGDLGTRLGEAEDVIDEQENVLVLDIAEVLRHGQAGQRDAQTRARRLVHLTEDEGGLVEDARLFHFTDEVVALTGALADAGEHGDTAVVLGNALDHLLNEDCLTDARAAEKADLAALHVGGQQVDDLDAGLEHLGARLELVEGRGLAVDRPALLDVEGLALFEVEDVAGHVKDVALRDVADGHGDRGTGVSDGGTTHEAVGGLQRDGTHEVVTEVLGNLECHREGRLALALTGEIHFDGECVVERRDAIRGKLHIDDRADDAGDAPLGDCRCISHCFTPCLEGVSSRSERRPRPRFR